MRWETRIKVNGQLNIGMQEWVSTGKFIIRNNHVDTVSWTRKRSFHVGRRKFFTEKSYSRYDIIGLEVFPSRCFRYIVEIQTNPIKLQFLACAHVCSNKLLSIQPSPNTAKRQREKKSMCDEITGATYAEEMRKKNILNEWAAAWWGGMTTSKIRFVVDT